MVQREAAQLGVEVHWDHREALILVRGELDGVSAADLAERLLEVDSVLRVLNGKQRRLVVDLAGVGFINQAAVRALVGMRERLSPECVLLLRSPSRAARKLLARSGLLDEGPAANGQAARVAGDDQAAGDRQVSRVTRRHESRR